MLVILPLICFVFIFLFFQKSFGSNPSSSWRGSFLSAALVWGLLLTAITELLSAFNVISTAWVSILWLTATVPFAILSLRYVAKQKRLFFFGNCPVAGSEILMLSGVIFTAGLIGVIALIVPPNNYDSMTYHMPRVLYWIQDGSVAHYPTHILRQLHQNPWAEFTILHLQLLSDSDRFANLVQWFGMVGSMIGVSIIAQQLGANRRGQILAALVLATLPMGILQGSTTQNDYVVGFWLVCLSYGVLKIRTTPNWRTSLVVGASLGLGLLTKATVYVYAFPLLMWWCFWEFRRSRWGIWRQAIVILPLALLINLGHYSRNLDLYGSPLGPASESATGEYRYSNEVFSVETLISNTVRNAALQIGTPSATVNTVMETGIDSFHSLVGIQASDHRTTWTGEQFHIPKMSRSEDNAGNAIHLALIVLSIILLLINRGTGPRGILLKYALALCFAFLFFAAYLKWQPWNSRLHLPLFVLWAPFVAVVIDRVVKPKIVNVGAALLLLTAMPWLLYGNRPLIGGGSILAQERAELYFSLMPQFKEPYAKAAQLLGEEGCSQVGLVTGQDTPEYLLWVLMRNKTARPIHIEHVYVTNISQVKSVANPSNELPLCAIVSLAPSNDSQSLDVGGRTFYRVESSPDAAAVFGGR